MVKFKNVIVRCHVKKKKIFNALNNKINSHFNFSSFRCLVDDVGSVEHDALKEEDEGDPLVVGLDLDEVAVFVRSNAGSGDIFTDLL